MRCQNATYVFVTPRARTAQVSRFVAKNPMSKASFYGLTTIWFGLVVAGFVHMASYQSAPGQSATAARRMPTVAQIKPVAGAGTIVMFIHPKCPCTQASLSELERLVGQIPAETRTYVVCAVPADVGEDWLDTALVSRAKSLADVVVLNDTDGEMLSAFDAKTSGETFVYGENTELIFHGGITPSRGHEGTNAGRVAVAELLGGRTEKSCTTPIFGCPLVASFRK